MPEENEMTEVSEQSIVDGYIRVGQLRSLIEDLDDDVLVVLQKDAEGNGYSPLAGGDEGRYLADSTWSGDAYQTDEQLDKMIKENPDAGWSDEDRAPEEAVKCFVLWPVN